MDLKDSNQYASISGLAKRTLHKNQIYKCKYTNPRFLQTILTELIDTPYENGMHMFMFDIYLGIFDLISMNR